MIRTFNGKNSFALNQAVKEKVSKAIKEFGDFGVEKIDASEVSADLIIQSAQSLPFLADGKLILVSNASSNNELIERSEELIERTPESVEVVLVGPVFDKRKSEFKTLKQKTELQEFGELKEDSLVPWLVEQATKNGAKITVADARYLIERIGPNQQMLASEVNKLAIYDKNISKNTIDLLTDRSAQSTIFLLLDSMFSGQKEKTINLYRDQRQQKIDPHYIISMIVWQLYNLAMAVHVEPRTESALIEAGMSPFIARKYLKLSNQVSKKKLQDMVNRLVEIDTQIKTSADVDAALELYLVESTF